MLMVRRVHEYCHSIASTVSAKAVELPGVNHVLVSIWASEFYNWVVGNPIGSHGLGEINYDPRGGNARRRKPIQSRQQPRSEGATSQIGRVRLGDTTCSAYGNRTVAGTGATRVPRCSIRPCRGW